MFLAKTLASPSDNAASQAQLAIQHISFRAHMRKVRRIPIGQRPICRTGPFFMEFGIFKRRHIHIYRHIFAQFRPHTAHFRRFQHLCIRFFDHLVKSLGFEPSKRCRNVSADGTRFNPKRPPKKSALAKQFNVFKYRTPQHQQPKICAYHIRILDPWLSIFSIAIPFARRSNPVRLKSFPPTLTRHCFPTSRGLLE